MGLQRGETAMSFGNSVSPRFKVATAGTPGPGTYYKETVARKRSPPSPTRKNTSQWLQGSMGATSPSPKLSSESYHIQQKSTGRGLDGPGPGAYVQPSCFARATYKPPYQVTLEQRAERGLTTPQSNYRGGYPPEYRA